MKKYDVTIQYGRTNKAYAKIAYYDYDIQKDVQLYLCSKNDPEIEAKRWCDVFYDEYIEHFFVYGMGLGYHIKALLDKLKPGQKLYVLEGNIYVQEKLNPYICLTREDLSKINWLCTGELYDACEFLQSFIEDVEEDKFSIQLYGPSLRIVPEELKMLKDVLENYQLRVNTNIEAREEILTNYKAHEEKNYPNVSQFYDSLKNKPIIIVSGGPSLDKNIEVLKNANHKVTIFSTGTALKALIEKGVHVDMFCIIDAKLWVYKQIEGLEDLEIPFIFMNTVRDDIVSRYRGPKYIAYSMDSPKEQEGRIESGGSVATAMLDLALKFGANPVIFVGQDLAYTDGSTHFRNAAYVKELGNLSNYKKVKSIKGGYLPTSKALYSYKCWIEQKISANPSRRYINATEEGAYIEGCKHMPLLEILKELDALND